MVRILFIFVLIALGVGACSHPTTYRPQETKIAGAKIIALRADPLPWVIEIDKRLRAAGFTVLRFASLRERIAPADDGSGLVRVNEGTARYILTITGEAGLDKMTRCVAGGYNFSFINAELMDVTTNEMIASFSGNGYSENCAPLSGKLFGDVTNMVVQSW